LRVDAPREDVVLLFPELDRRDGTLPPASRASDKPIAIACFRLFTFSPEPLLSSPRLNSCIVFSTFSLALGPYFAMSSTYPLVN
jgi:hypothetical protein